MALPAHKENFNYVAKPGEIIIPAKFGFSGLDIGPAYIIDNSINEPINANINAEPEERKAQLQKFEDAYTELLGTFSRMEGRSKSVAIEIRDVYQELLEMEADTLTSAKKKSVDVINKIENDGITAERAIYDYFEEKIKDTTKRLKYLDKQDFDKDDIQYKYTKKALAYYQFFQAALVNLTRGKDLHTFDRIKGDKEHNETEIPIADNFQIGQLAFLKDETGHNTKVHSILRYKGTAGDHTEVIAKGLRIAVGNFDENQLARLKDGKVIVVDGHRGVIIVNPAQETINDYKQAIEEDIQLNRILAGKSGQEKWSYTEDGVEIKISANIGFADEMYAVNTFNAGAVGLYRSEIAIKARHDLDNKGTDLNKFVEIYDQIAKSSIDANGKAKSITMRTPDFEGDKNLDSFSDEKKQQLIQDSIEAMHITAKNNPDASIHIMFPMINDAAEYNEMREKAEKAAQKVGIPPLTTGSMIETPDAIKNMGEIDAEFFSIGTNDLIPRLLKYDRYEPVAEGERNPYDPTNPIVLKALQDIQTNAREKEKENKLSICGDIASDPRYFALLIGMGYTHLSCGPAGVPFHKELVRQIDTNAAKELVADLLKLDDREAREEWLNDFNEKYLGLNPNRTFKKKQEHDRPGASSEHGAHDHDG